MVGLALSGFAFAGAYLAGRRSLLNGVLAVLVVGYFFGIIRANNPSSTSFFVFDAAVVALYLSQLLRPAPPEERPGARHLAHWVALLAFWPLLLLLAPAQDPMVQLVGLRAHVLLLPFLVFGARLRREEVDRLALWLAGLNLVALAFAVAELLLGLEHFYPRNAVTEIIYRSNDIKSTGDLLGAFRIPATFANASSYGATMAITVPLLLGAWVERSGAPWRRWLLSTGLAASILGVFLAASRTHILILLVLLGLSVLSGRMGFVGRAVWVVMLGGLGALIATNERLFLRVLTLGPEAIFNRVYVSVNETFVNRALEFPLGNGLGGGGTSMPYFLQHLVRDPVVIENQYATFMLEMGLPGLLLWVWFLAWAFTRGGTPRSDRWHLGRRLAWWACAAYYAQGLIGIGFLTSVPFSALLLLCTGWIAVPQREESAEAAPAAPRPLPAVEGPLVRAHA